MPDYSKLIDAETWAFIRESESWYPPETATYPIGRQREIYDTMCRAFHRGYPPGLAVEDRAFGGVPCRVYMPEGSAPTATVLYLHGGGFVVGGLESHDDVCAEIASATGYRVVAADYRLAPEHRHPAHFDDALAAFRAVAAAFPGPLVLAGDSAGGNLAAAVAHATRGLGLPLRGQVLIYPGLGGDKDRGSYLAHAEAPMLTRDDVLFYGTVRYEGGQEPEGDPTAQPLADHDFAGLPPTLIHVAECDPLADDGPAYAAKVRRAGGQAHCVIEPGLVHGYLRARRTVGRAGRSFANIVEGIRALGRGDIPWRGAL
ncbi:MAG: alpha/beta hydrolase [Paracoccaceae bacterium]